MVVFGLSRSLGLGALAVSGFVDVVGMNIRSTVAALATPDGVRSCVLAIEMIFISASDELGAFESGVAPALPGATTAVGAGGLVTIGLAAAWPAPLPRARRDRPLRGAARG